MATVLDEKPVPVVSNLDAPDSYADGAYGVFVTNGNVHITLVARRCDYSNNRSGHLADVVIGRLIMPISATEKMVQFIGDCLQAIKPQTSVTMDVSRILQ
jgi:hypothetical protein